MPTTATKKPATAYTLFDPGRTRCGYNNSKVCMPTLSTMPGTEKSLLKNASKTALALYADIIENAHKSGTRCTTCENDCPHCYAMNEKCYTAVFEKWLLNTLELFADPVRFYELVENELFPNEYTRPAAVRMHESGEFAGLGDIFAFCEFARRHSDTRFYGYSKDENIHEMQKAGTLPENVKFACSPWILADGTVLCPPIDNVYQFIFNDGTNPANDCVPKCPCSNPDGSVNKDATCAACGRCVRCINGTKTAVFPHGVPLAETWLAGRCRSYMDKFGLDYTTAAAAAYNDAMNQARKVWREKAAADLPARIAKLAKAIQAADKKAAKAAALATAAD